MKNLVLTLALLFPFFSQAQEQITFTVHFETNSHDISSGDIERLNHICPLLADRQLMQIESIGFADARGTLDRNDELGFRRARALATAFDELCSPDAEIIIGSAGERRSVLAISETDETLRADRKAVLSIRLKDIPPTQIPEDEDTADANNLSTAPVLADGSRFETAPRLDYIQPLIAAIDKKSQVFTVDPSEPIHLRCLDGATLTIPEHAIVDRNGNAVVGPVDIHYRSFMDSYSIIASGIPMHILLAAHQAGQGVTPQEAMLLREQAQKESCRIS